MAMAMWAKTAAGTNLGFMKGNGKAVQTFREQFQQARLRRTARKPRVQQQDGAFIEPNDRCLTQHGSHQRVTKSLHSQVFRSLFSRTATKSLAAELRRRSALRLSSSALRNFRTMPIMSLIGITLGLDFSAVINDSAEKMMSDLQEKFQSYTVQPEPLEKLPQSLDDLDINLQSIANGCEGAVYKAKLKTDEVKPGGSTSPSGGDAANKDDAAYDLAVKVVFNYEAESNSHSILRALERETVPLYMDGSQLNTELSERVNRLPPHPNIVDMPGMFVDEMLVTEEGLQKFPAAMPHKLDPEQCYGRNKTLYLVMRRRNTNLCKYLAENDITMETRCLMLAQLLEGVCHLTQHGVAHRDLKTNNILVDLPDTGPPRLEICDFGCCLAEKNKCLQVPFPSRDMYMGGNSWLMAPEIATATPGPGSVLDFRKSDLWAVGTIAYEILGAENPFYPSSDNARKQMSSRNYIEEELPPLPDDVPAPVKRLIRALLSRDPNKRPSASAAAAVVQMVVLEASNRGTDYPKYHSTINARATGNRRGWKEKKKSGAIFFSKEQEKFRWVLVQSLILICQLTFGKQSESWNMRSVMTFLFLSRLKYADFQDAVKFF